jgi:DNA-binding SARP family transcriptional activator
MTTEALGSTPGAHAICLSLMGGWSLQVGGAFAPVPHGVQRLLAFVALHRSPLRQTAASLLWPDHPEPRALGNLRSAIWRAHRISENLLREEASRLHLGPAVEVDLDSLSLPWQRGSDAAPPALTDELLTAELLPGWYEDWVLTERERLRQKRLHALEALARGLAAEGRFAESVQTALAVISADPLRESAHRVLIEVHVAEGNVGEARRAYEQLRVVLAAELGLEPSPVFRTTLAPLLAI